MADLNCSLPTCGRERQSLTESGWVSYPLILVRLCPDHVDPDHIPEGKWIAGELRVLCTCGSRIGSFTDLNDATNEYASHLELMTDETTGTDGE